jgi:hypothetical protein
MCGRPFAEFAVSSRCTFARPRPLPERRPAGLRACYGSPDHAAERFLKSVFSGPCSAFCERTQYSLLRRRARGSACANVHPGMLGYLRRRVPTWRSGRFRGRVVHRDRRHYAALWQRAGKDRRHPGPAPQRAWRRTSPRAPSTAHSIRGSSRSARRRRQIRPHACARVRQWRSDHAD